MCFESPNLQGMGVAELGEQDIRSGKLTPVPISTSPQEFEGITVSISINHSTGDHRVIRNSSIQVTLIYSVLCGEYICNTSSIR